MIVFDHNIRSITSKTKTKTNILTKAVTKQVRVRRTKKITKQNREFLRALGFKL